MTLAFISRPAWPSEEVSRIQVNLELWMTCFRKQNVKRRDHENAEMKSWETADTEKQLHMLVRVFAHIVITIIF